MKIKITQEVKIPNGMYCKFNRRRCRSIEYSDDGLDCCRVFNRFLKKSNNRVVKCNECLIECANHLRDGA